MESLDDEQLCQKLEQLAIACTDCINVRDFAFSTLGGQEAIARISPDFEARLGDGAPIAMSWDAVLDATKVFCEAKPEAWHTIKDISSYVEHKTGTAFVYLELGMQGADPGLTVHGMSTYLWKKNGEGKWMLFRYWNMRNVGGNGGF